MAKEEKEYDVIFKIPAYITVRVKASSDEDARENASEGLNLTNHFSREGLGTTIAIEGKNNSIMIDTDNCYERIDDVTEVQN